MAGLRDGLQRSRELYLAELEREYDVDRRLPVNHAGSLPQRVRHIGFSVRGAGQQSAWKRRFGRGTTAPTETTLRATLLTRCALLHSLGGVLVAGAMTVVFLESQVKDWLWLVLLSMLVAIYGVVAYWYAEHVDRLGLARWIILGGDLLALTWLWLLLGPSLVFALLLPGIALLALVLSDRRDLLITAAWEVGVLVVLVIGNLAGWPHPPLRTPPVVTLLLTLLGSLACLGWMIAALLMVLERRDQLGSADHWNSAEIARVRIESDIHLRQLQDGIATLQGVLGRVAGGELHARVVMKESELAPIAAKVNSLLDRQEQMFEEARQHRQLEAAVAEMVTLLEALHRGERVGWPAPTGTQVDRILALMRAPLSPRPLPRITTKLPATSAPAAQAPEGAAPAPASTRNRGPDAASTAVQAPAPIRRSETN